MSYQLYLDTADLISIADRKVNEETWRRLVAACDATQTTLLVSLWHVADLRSAPADAAQRVVDAVATFPRRALVSLTEDDVVVIPLDDLSALIREHRSGIEVLNEITSHATMIEQSVESSAHLRAQRVVNLSTRVMVAMVAEVDDANALRVAQEMLHKFRRDIPPEQHDLILQSLMTSPFWQLRAQFRNLGWDAARIASEVEKRDVQVPTGSHLGRHLGALVHQRRIGQVDRGAQDGDVPDRHHVEFAPYVDIFTCDKDICAWIDEWRTKLPYARSLSAFRSNHLQLVVEELERRS